MRVDNDPAVMPEGGYRQVVEPVDALPVPVPSVHISVSQVEGCPSSAATNRLISRDRLACCGTLAALCLCQVWFCFLAGARGNRFYYQGESSAGQFAALLADTLLLTGLFVALAWGGTQMCRLHGGEWLRDAGLLLFLAVPMNAIRGVYQPPLTGKLNLEYWRHAGVQGFPGVLKFLSVGGVLVLLAAILYFHRPLVRVVCRALVLAFPLVPFMLAEASWLVARHATHAAAVGDRPSSFVHAARVAGTRPQRVVWIIFDEMDYRLAFETAAGVRLTEFHRLARESLAAVRAYPPGGRTLVSVPALLAGRLVTSSQAMDAAELQVRYEGAAGPIRWGAGQTILALERERGWRTAVAGWYFPYERIFGADTEAWQYQGWRLSLSPNRPFAGLMSDEFRVLEQGKTHALLGESLSVAEHERIVRETVRESIHQAANTDLDLVFLHLPVPHGPFFHDAKTGLDSSRPRPPVGYFDHLELGDQVLGQIRRAMMAAGVADKTALLVSSDHWNRQSDLIDGKTDHRVPFLVSFPGSRQAVRYSAPFNTILSRRLVTAILNGEVHNAGETARWIDREKGGLTESPYNRN